MKKKTKKTGPIIEAAPCENVSYGLCGQRSGVCLCVFVWEGQGRVRSNFLYIQLSTDAYLKAHYSALPGVRLAHFSIKKYMTPLFS